MNVTPSEPSKRAPRPPSNWAQIVSSATSLLTVALAVYALFFSSTSQVLVQYLQSEVAYRNKIISNLQDTKENLEKGILVKEGELQNLNKQSSEMQSALASLDKQRSDAETQITALKQEQSVLSRAIVEARSESQQNEFSYVKERLAGQSEAVIMVTWVLSIGEDEKQTRIKRETLWPQYLRFYRKVAGSFPEKQRAIAQRIVSLFEKQCGHFENIVFDIPVPEKRISDKYERVSDPRIEKIREKALDTEERIIKCMRSVRDE